MTQPEIKRFKCKITLPLISYLDHENHKWEKGVTRLE